MNLDATQLLDRLSSSIGVPQATVAELASMIAQCDMTSEAEVKLKAILAHSQLDRHWNYVLDHERAEYLARHVCGLLPEKAPRVLDVLAGTGTVAAELRRLGCQVIEIERLACYPDRKKSDFLQDFTGDAYQGPDVDVALIIASMHHETYLDQLIGWLYKLNVNRYLVIENLRSDYTTAKLHAKFDWLFNRCLNSFGEECPQWYWTAQQWILTLSSLGTATWLGRMDNVPGIPFAYDLFEVLRRAPQQRTGLND